VLHEQMVGALREWGGQSNKALIRWRCGAKVHGKKKTSRRVEKDHGRRSSEGASEGIKGTAWGFTGNNFQKDKTAKKTWDIFHPDGGPSHKRVLQF